VFLAVALGLFLKRPRSWWLAGLAPAVALAAHRLSLGPFATPIAVIAACLLVPRYAPVALVLAIPIYKGPWDVFCTVVLWFAVSALMEGLEDRFTDEVVPSRVRLLSVRLLSVAVLYYTLLPVMFL
jgi:hypothetical protein